MDWLEGCLKIIQFHGQGPLDQVAQSPIQPGLQHFREWSIHSFSGQSVPVPLRPLNKELLPGI